MGKFQPTLGLTVGENLFNSNEIYPKPIHILFLLLGWEEVADIICDNAYFDWKKLAEVLGVDPGEISKLQKSKLPLQEKCWKVTECIIYY